MKKNKRPIFFVAVIATALLISGCTMEPNEAPVFGPDPIPGNPTGGPITRTAHGWASTPSIYFVTAYGLPAGDQVSATLTVTDGFITYLRFEADPRETWAVWLFPMMHELIMTHNSIELLELVPRPNGVDVITAGTPIGPDTFRGGINAARAALQAIKDGYEN